MQGADLGRGWSGDELRSWLERAAVPYERPPDIAAAVAGELARNGIVAWFQGRSEYGPRALGHRSLLAHPGYAGNLERLNAVKGREEFRPVAPMVAADRAADIFQGPPCPARTCSSCTAWHGPGATASPPSSTWTARPASRPSRRRANPWWRACSPSSRSSPGCRSWSTPASTPQA
ncbi:hypothetical protein GCM10020000_01880 [Streptomyces olivoverticillatus]